MSLGVVGDTSCHRRNHTRSLLPLDGRIQGLQDSRHLHNICLFFFEFLIIWIRCDLLLRPVPELGSHGVICVGLRHNPHNLLIVIKD